MVGFFSPNFFFFLMDCLQQKELIKKDGRWESFKILVLLGLVFLQDLLMKQSLSGSCMKTALG